MRKLRYLVAAGLIFAGCESQEFNLLPREQSGATGIGEGGDGGDLLAPKGGTGGAGKGGEGAGGTGGRMSAGGSIGAGSGGAASGMTGEGGGPTPPPPCPAEPCSQCLDDRDCNDPIFQFCFEELSGWKHCVQCRTRDDCDPEQACDPFRRMCVPACDNASHCRDPRPICDVAAGICTECTEDSHCATHNCVLSQCVQCANNQDCYPWQVCGFDWKCRGCYDSVECGQGRECLGGRCMDVPPGEAGAGGEANGGAGGIADGGTGAST